MDTDVAADRFLTVSAVVYRPGSADGSSQTWIRSEGSVGSVVLPASFAIIPNAGDSPSDPITLVINARLIPGTHGEPAIEFRRTARFRFVPHHTAALRVFLSGACGAPAVDCHLPHVGGCTVGAICEESGLTCGDYGRCESPDVVLDTTDGAASASPFHDAIDIPADAFDAAPDRFDAPPDSMDVGIDAPTDSPDTVCANCMAPANSTATCVDAMCAFTCAAGFGNCNAIAGDGCETPLSTVSNCSTCGHACAAGEVCTGGACVCAPGHSVCAGACVDTATDVGHCGSCNNVCPGTAQCNAGFCGPQNDTCATAVLLTPPGMVSGNTCNADATVSGCGPVGPDVFVWVNPTMNANYTFSVSSGFVVMTTNRSCGNSFQCFSAFSGGLIAGQPLWFGIRANSGCGPFTFSIM